MVARFWIVAVLMRPDAVLKKKVEPVKTPYTVPLMLEIFRAIVDTKGAVTVLADTVEI